MEGVVDVAFVRNIVVVVVAVVVVVVLIVETNSRGKE